MSVCIYIEGEEVTHYSDTHLSTVRYTVGCKLTVTKPRITHRDPAHKYPVGVSLFSTQSANMDRGIVSDNAAHYKATTPSHWHTHTTRTHT